jgi:hypothetical protein
VDVLVLPPLGGVGEEVLDVERPVRVADDVDRPVAVVTGGVLDQVTLYKLKLLPAKPDRPGLDALRREHVFAPRILSET